MEDLSWRDFALRDVACVAHTRFPAGAFSSCWDDMVMKKDV